MHVNSDTPVTEPERHDFEAEVSQVLSIVINSLYSNKEIFVRELVSNASDALDKLRYRGLTDHDLAETGPLEIRISVNEEAQLLTIEDTGVGMTRDELIDNLGTVARSGSRTFLNAAAQAAADGASTGDVSLIGQFGVGFYSAYLVADEVTVISRSAGSDEAWCWRSDGQQGFTLEPATRESHGTTILLKLKDEQKEYLSPWRLQQLVRQHSDYVPHPILVETTKYETVEGQDEPVATQAFEQANRATALWQRPKAEVTDEEYAELYKHIGHDFEDPLTHTHFKVEGRQLFTGVLFVPRRAPFGMYSAEPSHGVRLHVKRVLIMDECKEIVPFYLRFLRGVIDSDDLPLNVSREILQDSGATRLIKKQVEKRTFDMLDALAKDKPEDYELFWSAFGPVIKEGFHTAPEHKKRLAKLARFRSTRDLNAWTSLADYRERMAEGQPAIYYVIGESAQAAASSPHIEGLTSKGFEVLLLTDPIDEWAAEALGEFDDIPLASAMKAEFPTDPAGQEDDAKADEADAEATDDGLDSLIAKVTDTLKERVKEVRRSSRLTASPSCLVVPDGGHHAHVERMFRATQPNYVGQKRILELNPDHALIKNLAAIAAAEEEGDANQLSEWIEVLYAQSLLGEGGLPEDPNRFAAQISSLLAVATGHAVATATASE